MDLRKLYKAMCLGGDQTKIKTRQSNSEARILYDCNLLPDFDLLARLILFKNICRYDCVTSASLVSQTVKNPPRMWETWV